MFERLLVRITHPLRAAPRPESQSRQGSLRAKPSYPSRCHFQRSKYKFNHWKHWKGKSDRNLECQALARGGIQRESLVVENIIIRFDQKFVKLLKSWCSGTEMQSSASGCIIFVAIIWHEKNLSGDCDHLCGRERWYCYREGGMSSSEKRQQCLPSSHEPPTHQPRTTSPTWERKTQSCQKYKKGPPMPSKRLKYVKPRSGESMLT